MTKQECIEMVNKQFQEDTIQLSQMVSDGKLSSTNAKIVFEEIWNNFHIKLRLIEMPEAEVFYD